MRNTSGKSFIAVGLLLALLVASFPGCGGAPSQEVNVRMSFSEPPVLAKPVRLTATFSLREKYYESVARDVTARIVLPEGFEKIDGDLEWKGDVIRGNSYTIGATVKAVKTGVWRLEASVRSFRQDGVGGGVT